jgi:hypothetical protein
MMHSFPELTVGGVLVAPFVMYAGAAIARASFSVAG